jgi:hypothetical protein
LPGKAGYTGIAPCKTDCTGYDDSQAYCTPPIPICSETDLGNFPLVYGTTTITLGSQTVESHSDTCTGAKNLTEYYCSAGPAISSADVNCQALNYNWWCVNNQCMIPEFTTIGAGIALIGASLGFWQIRKKRK